MPDSPLVCWLLDTRSLWPGTKITSADGAAQCMDLVSPEEKETVLSKMFIADAKMSLASALLKRLFVSQALGLPWEQVRLGRRDDEKHGKPCAVDGSGQPIPGIDFNVSHQNGLVALIGWCRTEKDQGDLDSRARSEELRVGVDIVCVDERKTASSTIDAEGFPAWVDVYESVFSTTERDHMKHKVDAVILSDDTTIPGSDLGDHARNNVRRQTISFITSTGQKVSLSTEDLLAAKLRRFYAYFCYKEAYIKLSGKALLALWLRELEFFNVRSPRPHPAKKTLGDVVDDVEVSLRGQRVEDVKMKLQAFEDVFMLSTAIQGDVERADIPQITILDLSKNILSYAPGHSSSEDADSAWTSRYF